jgi:hypothetical protein
MLKVAQKIGVTLLIFCVFVAANQTPKSEYAVKGAILCKICSYAKWTPTNGESFIIGIIGQLPEGSNISVPKNYLISGKKAELRTIHNLNEISDCQAVFVTESASSQLDKILTLTKNKEILTFCDRSELLRQGLMFNLIMVGSKVKFEINRKPIRETNISVSAPIYEVALRVLE